MKNWKKMGKIIYNIRDTIIFHTKQKRSKEKRYERKERENKGQNNN